jgi:site-specific recombinase XerD
MAVELHNVRRLAPAGLDPLCARLHAALDLEALIDVGYDPDRQVFAPLRDHAIFGFTECAVRDCPGLAAQAGDLCGPCARRWRGTQPAQLPLQEFIAIPRLRVVQRRTREVLCRVCCVPGFERPALGPLQLCLSCAKSFRRSGVSSVDEWITGGQHRKSRRAPRAPARARPTYGRCERCGRLASHPRPLSCGPCQLTWRKAGKPGWERWRREHPVPVSAGGRVLVLSSLPERVRLEFLVGLQDALGGERKFNAWSDLTRVAHRLIHMKVESVLDLAESPVRTPMAQLLFARIRWAVEHALLDPEEELLGDVWRLGLLRRDGGRQKIDLTVISQPWLREIYRDWAREALAGRHIHYLRSTFCQIRRLSESLRTRADGGVDRTTVGRRDIENFLVRLAGLASTGEIANSSQVDCVTMVRYLLRRARDRGLTAPGGPLHGLPDTFAFYEGDIPQREERDPDDEIGRSLPNSVIKQLASPQALAVLTEASTAEIADAAELLIRTGRRPAEICHLRTMCLQWDERVRDDGTLDRQPVLVYRPEKTPKRSKRLPVHAREALIIKRAGERARARFPGVAPEKLPLFPRQTQNRSGTVPMSAHRVALGLREWMRRLPDLLDSDGTSYDRRRVVLYAFRHSYAQRLADQNCPPHLLMDLMDHRSFRTTEGYCRIRQDRRREAVDLGQRWQWDAQGNELAKIIERFAESEDTRIKVGSTAIPYGSCVEPSNVAALGSACPYWMRCIGCKHFRTDLTHLAALEKYLTDLLAARERILAVSDELADWAKRDAMPSDEHIDRVRYLIRRMREKFDSLPAREAKEIHRILGSQANDRRELGDLAPAAFQLNVIDINSLFDPAAIGA